jgi:CubicO group peptidase (beta-lactamase class C family)
MTRLLVFFIALVAVASCSVQKQDPRVAQSIRNVESGLRPLTIGPQGLEREEGQATLSERMAALKVPGVSIAVINGDRIEWAKGYGVLRVGVDAAVTTKSIFEAASTSKLVTAAIALHYVQEGALELDEDVNRYLKSWKLSENEFTREKKVTLRLLLTHQAGLPTTNFGLDENAPPPTLIQVLNGEPPARNKPAVAEFVPGSRWQYSNVAYDVIQLLLEDVGGKPFERIAQEIVFEPLGMKSSTFAYPLKSSLRSREAMPHDEEGAVGEPAMVPSALAHGGLTTTPSDLARFTIELMLAYRGKSDRILSPDMARQMFHRELDLDPSIFGFPFGEGLGVLLRGSDRNFSFLHPGSNLPGTTCWLEACPESGQGIVIMANGARGDLLSLEILPAVISEYQWPVGQY